MNMVEEIRSLKRRTELLAPAGRMDALEAVIEAGADAVYLSGKRFQMRAHRSDFHFDDEQLRDATQYVHAQGRRIYVTLNTILGEHELDKARSFLEFLQELGIDAIIACDLATISLAREVGVTFELHSSTMMNVHDLDQALMLKELGIDRMVTSRDISIQEAGLIGERSGVPVEYFLHGDMCVAESGQCAMSGVVLGKSANRGECMKPCRWNYELVSLRDGCSSGPLKEGHLMAIRDLTLIRLIPELVESGICALKIEGRMRDAAYLGHVVSLYREVIDQYYAMPSAFTPRTASLEKLFKTRVRNYSALIGGGGSSNSSFFDTSGKREPLMLSNGCTEPSLMEEDFVEPDFDSSEDFSTRDECPELAVCVRSIDAAQHALDAGADRIYLAAETPQYAEGHWTASAFQDALKLVNDSGVALGIRTPRVSPRHARAEWIRLVELCEDFDVRYILAHHLGSLKRAREDMPTASIIADYGFNALNPVAITSLEQLGADAVVPALESGYEDVRTLIQTSVLPVELLVHGPVTGMLLAHCLIAMNLTKTGSKDVCRAPCIQSEFALRDQKGETRAIITDQYCRNHILTGKDLSVLPRIDAFLRLGATSFRIEGQFYPPELVGQITRAYRSALDRWKDGEAEVCPSREEWEFLLLQSQRPWNYGAYAQQITHSKSTAKVMRAMK